MQAAIPRIVDFENPTTKRSLQANISLIAFGNAEAGIQTTQESGVEHPELFCRRRINRKRLWKVKSRGDERAALAVAHQLAGGGIHQCVCVKEKWLRPLRDL